MKNSEKLLDKIQSEHVVQKKRIEFTSKNIFFWVLFCMGILIGGIAFSVVLFAVSQTDFDILEHITHSRVEFFLSMLPIVWIIFTLLFLAISYWGAKGTKKGYKYSPLTVFIGSVVFSTLLGTAFYFSGGAQRIENIFAKNVPGYQSIEEKRQAVWSTPEEGFLSGTITSINETLGLKDWSDKEWQIDTSNALIRGRASIKVGEQIKIIGTIEGDNIFIASEIRPWIGRGNNAQNH